MGQTIQNVIDGILTAIPEAPLPETVDTFKTGDPEQQVTGVATTFLANCEVIEQAIQLGANLIITHEPTFYNHLDDTGWLSEDAVYQAKRRLIDEHNLMIWRFHDYWHMHNPDGILTGVLKELGWEAYASPEMPYFCHIPSMPLRQLAVTLKDRLGAGPVRLVGDLDMVCQKIGLALGAAGGEMQIQAFKFGDLDVVVCGEIHEWETSEYVRDAVYQGNRKALIVLGHAASEQAGMKWLADWLPPRFPGLPITYIPVNSPFHWV